MTPTSFFALNDMDILDNRGELFATAYQGREKTEFIVKALNNYSQPINQQETH